MASTYTFTKKPAPIVKGGAGHFENQPVDGARVAIQGIGNGIQTEDATPTSPVTSPVTVADNAVTTLITPESAVQIKITAITEPVNISEVVGMGTYYQLAAGGSIEFDIANQNDLYLEAVGGSATVSFAYVMV